MERSVNYLKNPGKKGVAEVFWKKVYELFNNIFIFSCF